MKYYPNYVLKKIHKNEILNKVGIFINGQPLIIPYETNSYYLYNELNYFYYWVRVDMY